MRKLATVRIVSDVLPIEGADRIELAIVDGWKCVIKKSEFQPGDLAIYCEIDSFLPIQPEFEFLRKSSFKKMGDEEGFRLRTVKLRGQISQGLLLSPSTLNRQLVVGEDVTEELGIKKYEPPVPASLSGEIVGPFPAAIAKTDEERIQNLASVYATFLGKPFYVTEKLDGTSFTAFFDDDVLGICGRNWQLAESKANTHWQIARKLELEKRLGDLVHRVGKPIAIQGELLGPGIQSNRYQLKEHELFVFNVFDLDNFSYVEKEKASQWCDELGVQQVPYLETRQVPDSIDAILDLAEGKSVVNESTEREGLVWVHGAGAERISFKTISNKFLAREGVK